MSTTRIRGNAVFIEKEIHEDTTVYTITGKGAPDLKDFFGLHQVATKATENGFTVSDSAMSSAFSLGNTATVKAVRNAIALAASSLNASHGR